MGGKRFDAGRENYYLEKFGHLHKKLLGACAIVDAVSPLQHGEKWKMHLLFDESSSRSAAITCGLHHPQACP
jgi:hypothetical protein